MREYINIYTGEVIIKRTILGARAYFKKDARKYHYEYNRRHIMSIRKYKAML